ncbi:MAG: MFS transporter [Thermoplasmataceae archaeon]
MSVSTYRRIMPLFLQIMILQLLANFTNNSYSPLSVFIKGTFSLNSFELGIITSAVFAGSLLAANIGGFMVDRLGSKTALRISFFLLSTGSLIALSAHSYYTVVAGYSIIGFGYGIVTPATNSAIIELYYPKHTVPMGVKQAGVPLGALAATLALPVIAIDLSLRYAFLAMMLLALVIALVTRGSWDNKKRAPVKVQVGKTMREALRNRKLVVVSTVAVFLSLGQQAIFTFLVVFMKFRGYDVLFSEILLGTMLIGSTIGRIVWPFLSQRLFASRQIDVLLVIVVLSGIMLMSVPVDAFIWYTALAGSFFLGFTSVSWNSTFVTIVSEEAPREHVGVYSGVSLTIMYLGVIIGIPLYGYIIDVTTYTNMWIIGGSLTLIAAILLSTFRVKTRGKEKKMLQK